MNFKTLFVIFVSLFVEFPLQAQEYWSKTFRVENSYEYALQCIAFGGKIYVFGYSSSQQSAPIIGAQLSGAGDIIDTKTFGHPDTLVLSHYPGLTEHGGNLILSGRNISPWSDISPYGLQISLPDLILDTVWKIPLPGNYSFYAEGHQKLSNNSLLMYGQGMTKGNPKMHAHLIATDLTGTMQWELTFGESDNYNYKINAPLTWLNDSILVGIATRRINSFLMNANMLLFGVSPDGHLLFTEELGWPFWFIPLPQIFPQIHRIDESSFLFTTYSVTSLEESPPPRGYIVAMDTSYQELWRLFDDYENHIYQHRILRIERLSNGDFIGVGSKFQNVEKSGTSIMQQVGWAFSFSSDGDILWERHYCLPEAVDTYEAHTLFNVFPDVDGSMIMVGGVKDSIDTGSPQTYYSKNWVMKVGPDGCIEPGCTEQVILLPTRETFRILPEEYLRIFPNPIIDMVHVSWKELPATTAFLSVHDLMGRLMGTWPVQEVTGTLSLDVSSWPAGMAFLSLWGEDFMTMPVKVVKE